jgi:ABC-type phosphate transport system substrate-binding protein
LAGSAGTCGRLFSPRVDSIRLSPGGGPRIRAAAGTHRCCSQAADASTASRTSVTWLDYFTLAIVGQESHSRTDYTTSEDDAALVKGVAGDATVLGYFGYAYYLENKDKLKLISIDNGHGCIEPGAQTVTDGTYQPLSRPVFAYVNRKAVDRPEVKALALF